MFSLRDYWKTGFVIILVINEDRKLNRSNLCYVIEVGLADI